MASFPTREMEKREEAMMKEQWEGEEAGGATSCNAETSNTNAKLPTSNSRTTDLQGVCRLTFDAFALTTRLVEAAHSRYDPFSNYRYPAGKEDRAGGLARIVYKTIHAVNSAVGTTVDVALSHVIEPFMRSDKTATLSPFREQTVAVLNGVVGDYLADQNNPLAIPMQWRVNGTTLDDEMLQERIRTGRLLILLHGSCSTDLLWLNSDGHDHGASIASELGITPIYLFFNSGLHISDNGKQFALQMNRLAELAADADLPPLEISILAHSMGGLVARSACHYAAVDREQFDANGWLAQVQKIVFLGTPHHGAMLERGGKWIDYVLSLHRYSEPFSWIGKIRSRGVTDLGYGNVRHEDWQDGHEDDRRQPTPLPSHVQCYAIAAVASSSSGEYHFHKNIVGDGLVTENSALGQGHENPDMNLLIPTSRQKTILGVSHVGLLSSMLAYKAIKSFLVDTA
jgi:pimeloyl-ACP methyl ester carboxylesterase